MSDPTTPEQTTGQPLTPANIKTINQLPHLEDIDPDDVILVQDVSQNTYRKSSLQAVVDRMNPIQSVNLTRDEYDALPESEKLNGTYYNVTEPFPLQIYFDIDKPIGYVYEQLPPTLDEDGITRTPLDPNALFNNDYIHSTWKRLDFGGAFFRSEGGTASVFGTGIQEEQLPNITGAIGATKDVASSTQYFTDSSATNSQLTEGALYMTTSGRSEAGIDNGTASTNRLDQIRFDASRSDSVYTDGGEVRPANYTAIKWIRVA